MSYDMEYYTGRIVSVMVTFTAFYDDEDKEMQEDFEMVQGFTLSDLERAVRNFLPYGVGFEIQSWN